MKPLFSVPLRLVAHLGSLVVLCLLALSCVAQTYTMTNGQTVNACAGTFFDPGGTGTSPVGDYANSQNVTYTICSGAAGQCVRVAFTAFNTEANFDFLRVYDGATTAGTLLGTYSGNALPPAVTSTSGCLTFNFTSDGSAVRAGWTATISCVACPLPPAPANDLICNAEPIVCGQTLNGTSVGASQTGAGEGVNCGGNQSMPGVWYSIVGNGSTVVASLCGSAWDSRLAVFSGTCAAPVCVGGNNNGGPSCAGTSASFSWTATAGVTYYILVSGVSVNSAFSLALSCPPANDAACSAAPIACGQTLAGTTVGATVTGAFEGTTCTTVNTQPAVWYSITGNGQQMTASLCGTAWDSRIRVFSGADCNTLVCVAGNDDTGPSCAGTAASVSWNSAVGVVYYIAVSGFSASSAFSLALTCAAPAVTPPNDLICNATPISCGQTLAGTTVAATLTGTGEVLNACGGTATQPGVWYSVAGNGQIMTASLCGTAAWDSRIQIFSGANCNTIACVGGNDDGGPACAGGPASFLWTSVVGVNYYIFVSGFSSASAFSLALTCAAPPTPPANDLICNAVPVICGQSVNGTTVNATPSGTGEGQACGGFTQNQPGVWYSIVGSGSNINASLCASAWDSRIQVFTGVNCNTVTCVGGNDNNGPLCAGNAASYSWLAANGQTYYVLVSGATATTSAFTLSMACQTPCTASCNGGPPPANDACGGAQNLGAIPTPAACPNGVGAPVNLNTTNVCATAEPNYTSLLGCQPAGNQAAPAADVWYRFSIVAPVLNITINGLGTPNVALYEGTNCANLLPRGCAIGSGGLLNAQIQGLAPGTYYLQVSGGDVLDQCNFTLTLQNNYDCQGCVLGATLDATPPPVNGQYQPGTLVTFCYQVSSYSQISSNWLHGVIPTFGPGWDLSTFVALPTTTVTQGVVAPSCTPNGTWSWYNTPITSSFSGVSYGPGFFFETALGSGGLGVDGNPGNNFGDNNPGAAPPNTNPIDDCRWTFCWQIRTKPLSQCIQDQNQNVTINTTADSESGSYSSVACVLDPITNFFAQSNCCPTPTVTVTNPTCAVPTGSAIGQGLGTSPWTYIWKNSAGDTLLTNANTAGTSTITGLAAGDYTLTVTDATGCASFIAFSIVAPAGNTVSGPSTNPTLCVNTPLAAVTFTTTGATGIGTATQPLPAGVTASFSGNATSGTITISGTPTASGVFNYSIPLTGGCGNLTASGTITVNPLMTATSTAPNATGCQNQALSPNIVFNTTGATGIGAVNLPAGLVATFAGNATAGTVTISGTPTSTLGSPFAYSVALSGGCGTVNANGAITISTPPSVTANSVNFNSVCAGPIASESATPTITLTLTPSTAIANWSLYAGTTATGVPIQTGTGNPNYAFTNSTCSNQSYVYQIIPTLNGCNGAPLDISITVKPKPLSTFTVSPNPVCIGQTATLTYTSPTCPTSSFNWESTASPSPPVGYVPNLATPGLNPSATNAATVTVTPSVAGTYTIRVQSTVQSGCTGPMSPAIALVVAPLNTVTSSTPRIACQNQALSPTIQFTTTGATGISNAGVSGANGLPAGVSASWAGNTITISGTPTAAGTFNYSIPLTGGCGTVNATGTITVVAPPTATLNSSTSICPGSNSGINFSGTVNAGISWTTSTGLSGISPLNSSGSAIIGPGSINAAWTTWPAGAVITFSQVTINNCSTPINFVITVTSSINVTVAAQSPICAGSTSQLTFTGTPSATVTYNVGGGNLITNTGATGTFTVTSPTINSSTNVTVTLAQIAGGCSQVLSNSAPIVVSPANTAATPSANPTLCVNTALTPITIATTGATGISNAGISGANGLPAGVSASWVSNTITISGTPTAPGTFNYSIPLTGGCGAVNATGTIVVNALQPVTLNYDGGPFCPAFNSVPPTNSWTLTGGGGNYSVLPAGLDLNTGTGLIALNTSTPGTYTITFTPTGCASVAQATVVINDVLDFANLQFPANGTICTTGSFNAYGQIYNTGTIATTPAGAAAGVTAQIGYSTSDTSPTTWTNWIPATFNTQSGNNDEYVGVLSGLAQGTYYYAFRFQINGCAWQYGGYSATGGGFWGGLNVSGVLTVDALPIAGIDGAVSVCASGTQVPLFNSLTGSPATNGTWTGPSALDTGSLGNYDPLTDNPGTYTYTVVSALNICPPDVSIVTVTETSSPQASVAYASPICASVTAIQSPTVVGAPGGTFSALPAGLGLTAAGTFNPTTAAPGTYTVTYSIAAANGCAAFQTQASVVVQAAPVIPTLAPANPCAIRDSVFTAGGGSWYEFFVNGVSVGPASAVGVLDTTALAGGTQVCVRSYPAPPIMDGNLTDPSWTPVIPGTTGGPASQAPFAVADTRLDGLKMLNRNGRLYIGVAGNEIDGTLPVENNRILLFIDSKPGGFNSLATWVNRSNAGPPPFTYGIRNLDGGIQFDPGFEADYILSINRANLVGSTTFYDLYEMVSNTNVFLGSSPSAQFGYQESFTDNDLSRGFEFYIPLTAIASPVSLKVFGMLVNDPGEFGATLVSNQFFSVAGGGDGNYGNGSIFFGQAAPNPVTYVVSQDCYEQRCVTLTQPVVPQFLTPAPICAGGSAPVLPTSSNNVPPITGTWSGPVSNQSSGTYTFTPVVGQCATGTTLPVTVNAVPVTVGIFHD